jgi:hypothetical protein
MVICLQEWVVVCVELEVLPVPMSAFGKFYLTLARRCKFYFF